MEQKIEKISLNGLNIGQKYTIFQVETALGMPDEKQIRMDEHGLFYRFYYGNDIIHLNSETGINLFILRDKRFLINNHFQVGDSLSILLSTPNCQFKFGKPGECDVYFSNDKAPLRITITDNIITWIGFILS